MQYSPAAAGGGSNHLYSPTGVNDQFRSPAYSPTSPNNWASAGGIQQTSSNYGYGVPNQSS